MFNKKVKLNGYRHKDSHGHEGYWRTTPVSNAQSLLFKTHVLTITAEITKIYKLKTTEI